MGQITNPSSPGITVLPIDRQTGPSAGPGNSANDTLFLSANAGKNNAGANSIAFGNGALAGGNTIAGMIAIGVGAQAVSVGQRFAGNTDIAIGLNANGAAELAGDMIVIGTNALAQNKSSGGGAQGYTSVVIGNYALATMGLVDPNAGGIESAVVIGDSVGGPSIVGGSNSITLSIVLGASALPNFMTGVNGSVGTSTLIGDNILSNFASTRLTGSVIIGSATLSSFVSANNTSTALVAIGGGINITANTAPIESVSIGESAWLSDRTVCLGYRAGNQALNAGASPGAESIYLGTGAGAKAATAANWTFLIESMDDVGPIVIHSMMYGRMDTGNLAIGDLPAADRDLDTLGTTNAFKLTNGTRGAGAPTGGGFFYSNAGALHWVDTGGNDNLLSLNSTGQLAASSVAYTNNAGAQTATITNGPTAGNPTKWIPINDNGTIRNIPAW